VSNTDTGGPAFPQSDRVVTALSISNSQGMTMRDYFAAKAMQGDFNAGVSDNEFNAVAKRAYEMANAMLKAREQ
jgi:hypothetical protein